MRTLLATFARNTVFANIVMLLIFLGGGLATSIMVREMFPEFSLDMITVTVPYPGADPEEVEEGISRKLEEAVEGLEGIRQYTTYSSENQASMLVEVKETWDTGEVLEKVRTKINAINTFPKDAEKPIVDELMLRHPVMLLYLSGAMDERTVKEWAETYKDRIRQLPEVSQVEIFGARDYEIGVEVSETKLREYGLSFSQVADAIRQSNLNVAGGTIRTVGEEIRVRTIGRKYTGAELAKIVVMAKPDGDLIRLADIATIEDGFTEDPITGTIDGVPALMLIVFKTKEEDDLAISRALHRFVAEQRQQLPPGAIFDILYDNTQMLNARINLLVRNGTIGLCLVFFLLWFFLDIRLSFWSGLGIPISIAGAMTILWALGESINMISLFGLIMVLGIVVDDAIVVGEAIFVHRKSGKSPLRSAIDGVMEVGLPVIAAVVTTIVAFIPLAYIKGIMGKFISILPVVVISCLSISLLECLLLLPAHLSHLPDLRHPKTYRYRWLHHIMNFHHITGKALEWVVDRIYSPFILKAVQWRYVSLAIALFVLMITVGIINAGFLKFQVFPEIDGFVINSTVQFPNGTPSDVTQKAVAQIDAALMRLGKRIQTKSGDPLIKNRLALVGQTLGEIPEYGPHLGAVQAILLESEKRGVHSKDLLVEWEKEVGGIPGATSVVFETQSHGPPGAPIEIWIQGHRMSDLIAASQDLMARLKHFDGVTQIRSDFSPGKNEVRLTLKPEGRSLGITVSSLARQVYAGFYGEEAVRLQRGRDDVRVKVRYTQDERKRLTELQRMRIVTPAGHRVPIQSVANMEFTPGYATITRTDGLRRITVSAGIDSKKANASEILQELNRTFFSNLTHKYRGILVSAQGEQKKMRESFDSLQVGFPLAVVAIFIIIATMFRSYVQPFVILVTIPFSIIGAIFGHLALGYDLSLMSVFGMVALAGVVVNDAIVLIERINENLAEGMPFYTALQNAGKRRFRAIFLTTISTVGGLMPLILETDFQAKFLIPMAISIAGGVLFATVLTLVLIPSLMVILSDIRIVLHWVIHGQWMAREQLEPARLRNLANGSTPGDTGLAPF